MVVDEAYMDFADSLRATALGLIHRNPNLIVLRSFSKSFSLAGMRIGLAFAGKEIISGMMKVKDSYNLNRLSLVASVAALEDLDWMRRNVGRVQKTRAQLTLALERMGFLVHPSQANFVLARWQGTPVKGIYEELKKRGILIRYFDLPGLRDALRITVGTPKEIAILLRELAAVLR